MCDPLTIGATAVSALGALYQGASASAQAKGVAAQAAVNKAEAHKSAQDAIERGDEERQRHYRKVSAMKGAQRASMAANGIDIGFGDAVDVLGDTAMFGEEDAEVITDNAAREARGFEIQAANYEAERRSAKAAAKGAMVGAAFGATESILGGVQQYRSLKARRSGGS